MNVCFRFQKMSWKLGWKVTTRRPKDEYRAQGTCSQHISHITYLPRAQAEDDHYEDPLHAHTDKKGRTDSHSGLFFGLEKLQKDGNWPEGGQQAAARKDALESRLDHAKIWNANKEGND